MNLQSCCSALVCPALQVHSRAGTQPSVRWPACEPIRACPYVCWETPAAPEASAVIIESSERRVSFRPPSVTAQAMAASSCSRAWPQPRRAGGGEEFHCIAQLRPLPSCRIRPPARRTPGLAARLYTRCSAGRERIRALLQTHGIAACIECWQAQSSPIEIL